MKHFYYVLFVIVFLSISCQRNKDFNILFENLSDNRICIGWDVSYPVDSLNVIAKIMDPINPCFEINPHSQENIWQGVGKKLSWYYIFNLSKSNYNGYVSFTIMDKEIKNCGDLEKVQKEYIVLARYDLTIADIEDLGWRLTYPPSPELNKRSIWIKPKS